MTGDLCKCGKPIKYANSTKCEDCLINPLVSPSIDEFRTPSFVVADFRRMVDAESHRNPEQADRAEEIHDTEDAEHCG